MSIGSIIEGALLLISTGLNGLAIWYVQDYKRLVEENEELHEAHLDSEEHITELERENAALRTKLTPWNKGKAGTYKKKKTVKGPYVISEYADYPGISELEAL